MSPRRIPAADMYTAQACTLEVHGEHWWAGFEHVQVQPVPDGGGREPVAAPDLEHADAHRALRADLADGRLRPLLMLAR